MPPLSLGGRSSLKPNQEATSTATTAAAGGVERTDAMNDDVESDAPAQKVAAAVATSLTPNVGVAPQGTGNVTVCAYVLFRGHTSKHGRSDFTIAP